MARMPWRDAWEEKERERGEVSEKSYNANAPNITRVTSLNRYRRFPINIPDARAAMNQRRVSIKATNLISIRLKDAREERGKEEWRVSDNFIMCLKTCRSLAWRIGIAPSAADLTLRAIVVSNGRDNDCMCIRRYFGVFPAPGVERPPAAISAAPCASY